MNNNIFIAVALAAALCMGCGRRSAAAIQEKEHPSAHSHNGRDHDSHYHSGDSHAHLHDDETHSHDAHSGHDHSSCSGVSRSECAHPEHNNHGHASNSDNAGHDHDHHAHNSASGCQDHQDGSTDCAAPDSPEGRIGLTSTAAPDFFDEIIFTPAQAARTDFEVQTVGRSSFREVIKCSGTVSAAREGISVITAPIGGVVELADRRVMANSTVREGQKLFTLSSAGLASGDAVAKARIAYDLARIDFDRVSKLYEDKLVTNREYLAAEAEYLRAKAEYEPVSRSDGQGGTVVEAPSGGYLSEVMVSSGDYVEMGQRLAAVVRTNRMELRALVSQRYFDRLRDVDDATFRIGPSGDTYNISRLNGELYSVGRAVEQGSALIPVVFVFDGGGAIPYGAFAEVSLLGRRREGVITLPLTAITEQQGLYYVYVQLDEEGYQRREVKLGADDGLRVEILSGVGPGERAVTRGAINVKMASASASIPHGHTH